MFPLNKVWTMKLEVKNWKASLEGLEEKYPSILNEASIDMKDEKQGIKDEEYVENEDVN